jgi:hypothetical protein
MSRIIGDWSPDADKADGHGPHPAALELSTVDEAPDGRRRRRIWVAAGLGVLIVALFAGAAVGYSMIQPTVYGAQAEFVLTARPELSDAAVDRAMVTQTMVVQSDLVLGPVAQQAGVPLAKLREQVSVDIVGRSNVLRITVGDRDRARAVTLVQLIAWGYLRAPVAAPTVPAPSPATAGDTGPPIVPTVLTPPTALEEPLQPQPRRALAAGAILGLLVAAGVVTLILRPRAAARPAPHRE